MRRVTLNDVAQAAGLSLSAVSQALRGRKNIPAATQVKVREVAARLGYLPDPLLSALAARRHSRSSSSGANLAVVSVSESEREWAAHWASKGLLEGLQRRAAELGFALDYFKIGLDPADHVRLKGIFRARGIAGFILHPYPHLTDQLRLPWEELPPGVSLYGQPFGAPIPCVVSNHAQLMQLCCETAVRRGYRRLGLVLPREVADLTRRTWIGSFLAWTSVTTLEQVLLVKSDSLDPQEQSPEFDRTVMRWLEKAQPDAILYCSGPRLPATLKRNGVRCPEDLALCDLDLIDTSSGMTGIDQNRAMVAGAALDLLHGMIATQRQVLAYSSQSLQIESIWHEGKTMPTKSP